MKTSIGIKEEARQRIAEFLSVILADEHILYTKTRNAHWNVEGSDFHAMHLFFEEQYGELEGVIDEIAERIRQIGHYAPGTLKSFLELTRLTEAKEGKNDSTSYIKELKADHESIIIHIRENIEWIEDANDNGTADFLIAIMQGHEKQAWMLRAHLK
ncbi:Dps family protein [Myroides guanonis]|uniref:Starvation-inducible DNA-binding protein n=1 Tax=Myroides guanonis TaxID=1150112 RepID=A0A1I3MSX2_9FLAO|nr:DNA starvation/stationary phase protection protein [Myroides guanonis]SFJ00108.1 starvation-inducible DNA-binding protein [Myroides guanonis]